MSWTWLGYRRWQWWEGGYYVRGSGPRPMMDRKYVVIARRAVRGKRAPTVGSPWFVSRRMRIRATPGIVATTVGDPRGR